MSTAWQVPQLTSDRVLQQLLMCLSAFPAAIALLAFRRFAMSDDVDSLAIRAVQDLGNHRFPLSSRRVSFRQREYEIHSFETSSSMEPLMVGGHHLYQIADAVIQYTPFSKGYKKIRASITASATFGHSK